MHPFFAHHFYFHHAPDVVGHLVSHVGYFLSWLV